MTTKQLLQEYAEYYAGAKKAWDKPEAGNDWKDIVEHEITHDMQQLEILWMMKERLYKRLGL